MQASGAKALKYREQVPLSQISQREAISRDWCDHVLSLIGCSPGISSEDRVTMLMNLNHKVLEECSKAFGEVQQKISRVSTRLFEYDEFKGFESTD